MARSSETQSQPTKLRSALKALDKRVQAVDKLLGPEGTQYKLGARASGLTELYSLADGLEFDLESLARKVGNLKATLGLVHNASPGAPTKKQARTTRR
jgi:hypothetical protein